MSRIFLILLFVGLQYLNFAQTNEQSVMLKHFEDSLIELRQKVLLAENNQERIAANENFAKTFNSILTQAVSYDYGFDSIPSIGNLTSPDGAFRMLTWNLPFNDGTHEYYCYVQTLGKKKRGRKKVGSHALYKLQDKSAEIYSPERKLLSAKKWYGALYYEIIPMKKGGKTYYTLLGWDGNDQYTSKKIIDVMYFSGGQIKFGAPIFKMGKGTKKRVVFEHSAEVTMSVKYDKDKNIIVYDHLTPMREDLKGIRQYYVPDMSFDALELKKDKWEYVSDLDARNKEKILMPYNTPE